MKTKKKIVKLIAIFLAVIMPVFTASFFAFAESNSGSVGSSLNVATEKYEKPDINKLTGHGSEPEELSISAGATYQEKAWYEYVAYSENAVCSYRLNDDYRILFYDPYTYTNSMIMDVKFDATTTAFDTMSSYTVSNTTSKTVSSATESTYTNTNATQTSGRDITHSEVSNTGTTKTEYNHRAIDRTTGKKTEESTYKYKKYDTFDWSLSESLATGSQTTANVSLNPTDIAGVGVAKTISINGTVGSNQHWGGQWLTDTVKHETKYSDDYSTSTNYEGDDTVTYNTNSVTDGWTELSARVTKTIGSSSSTSTSWSETEGTTISKTYAATHFASDGVTPLPWAIVHYSVQMPMKCCLQVKYSGEWITISTEYCLLTTVKGTCRAWMENKQTYYEDWGSGEPVTATDFWSQFMTKDELMTAYNNHLYPTGGEN